ncbi:MAG: hypothetical protein NTW10_08565 [Bacteroidetes bacterium]|nr:hypothetical protein [Bacteroidota bacterium]MCX6306191.1 hypothetical protein [Bacteroidota bacterium]
MKKFYVLLLIVFFTMHVIQAQDLTSKKGIPILPEAGEFGLSIDAVPFFVYAGNFFHGTGTTDAPVWQFPDQLWTVQGKYFLTAKTALRGKIRMGFATTVEKNMVVEQWPLRAIPLSNNNYKSPDVSFPLSTVEDKKVSSDVNVVLGAGIEQRRGKGRIQGVYGAMFNIKMANSARVYKYGNDMDTGYYYVSYSGLTPDTNYRSFHRGAISTEFSSLSSGWSTSRTTKIRDGFTFGVGANIFIGVEYFFAPKISIGGEFSWGVMLSLTGKSTTTNEYVRSNTNPDGSTNHTIETYDIESAGHSSFSIDNTNTGGAINLSFYF